MSTAPEQPRQPRRSRTWLCWLVGMVGFALVCVLVFWFGPIPRTKLEYHLGRRTVAIISEAGTVETFRVEPTEARPDQEQMDYFPVTGKGPTMGEDFARRLGMVLLKTETHFIEGPSRPCFDPHHAFRLWRGKKSVDVVLCFRCHNLSVTLRDSDGNVVHRASSNMQAVPYAELQKLTLEVFPGDEKVTKDCGSQ